MAEGEGPSPAPTPLEARLAGLPDRPGVYRFLNRAGHTVYVGKAKSLRKRVQSYFRPKATLALHIARMVQEVCDLDLIVVDTEKEALLLEANLIKRERPRYNVVLRDDKSFPYLKLTLRDTYPRAAIVRRPRADDGNHYVGPLLPASNARRTLKLIQRQFRVATCREVFDGKRRPCLYYHLDQCLAPCAGKTNPEEYGRAVADARFFLDGRHRELERSLEERMRRASEAREYEQAIRHRDTLRTVRNLAERQQVTSVGLAALDLFAHHAEGERVALELFQVREGRLVGRREFTMESVEAVSPDFYATVLAQYYVDVVPPPEVLVPLAPREPRLLEDWLGGRRGGRVRLRVPRRGPKRALLELVAKNARLAHAARFVEPRSDGAEALAEALGLDEVPRRIECFDVSNIQGTDSVASLVVFDGGRPLKSEYRSFTLRDVEGADDPRSIAEAVTRRYRRLLTEDRRLPDLVLIDGGPTQLGAAAAALARVGLPMLAVAALAKREEELYLEGASGGPIRLDPRSAGLQLAQRIRDEAHRFAVKRHRGRRSARTLRTELDEVQQIGPVRAKRLLREFGSVQGVRQASREALERVVGRRAAAALARHFGPAGDG